MMSITSFDALPDLVLIELFSYLSSLDILWGFTHLNHRLTMLITERGFFHHINLSTARYDQFKRILNFLPLNEILSIVIDNDASPLQLTCWPYLPRLRILRIIGPYNLDDVFIFLLLHAATITHLIIKSNRRIVPDGFTLEIYHPIGDMTALLNKMILIRLPELRSLDLGMDNFYLHRLITTTIVPLTYLRLDLLSLDALISVMSTSPLFHTLRQLHVKLGTTTSPKEMGKLTSNISIRMVNLHTFTFLQTFFSSLTIEWTSFEMLTSSKVMPVLRRANMSIFISTDSLNYLNSSSLFTDYRHVDVHFAIHLRNCPQYATTTQYIPHGNCFHPREIIGARFVVNNWSQRSHWLINDDPFMGGLQYHHYMWYTLPWRFDEFFHDYIPYKSITQVETFYKSFGKVTNNQSSLRTLDGSGQTLPSILSSLPHVVFFDRIETLHLSFYTRPLYIDLSNLRNITLLNSINYLNYCPLFPPTVRSIRILLLYTYPNYIPPNWSMILLSLSTLHQLSSLRIFMYDWPKTVDGESCQMIAKMVPLFNDFSFCFRRLSTPMDDDDLERAFQDHMQLIKQLYHYILLFSTDKQFCYSIENDHCGLLMWF